jgi:hypothetical protein
MKKEALGNFKEFSLDGQKAPDSGSGYGTLHFLFS